MKRNLKISTIILSLCISLSLRAAGEGVCILDTVTTTIVQGQVVKPYIKDKEKAESPLQGALIELRKERYDGHLIAKIKADANGMFHFKNVRPGKYLLIASAPLLKSLAVPIELTKASKVEKTQQKIIIALNGDFSVPCGGGYIQTRQRK